MSASNVDVAELYSEPQPEGGNEKEETAAAAAAAVSTPVNKFTVKGPWHDKPEVLWPLTFVDPLHLLKDAENA